MDTPDGHFLVLCNAKEKSHFHVEGQPLTRNHQLLVDFISFFQFKAYMLLSPEQVDGVEKGGLSWPDGTLDFLL